MASLLSFCRRNYFLRRECATGEHSRRYVPHFSILYWLWNVFIPWNLLTLWQSNCQETASNGSVHPASVLS